jgi:predicted Zn-dependent protease
VYLDAGFPRMARLEVERVLARRPQAYDLLFLRGRTSLALGDAEAAAQDFGEAIAKASRATPAQVLARRDVLLSLGRKEAALQALDDGMVRVGRVVTLTLPAIELELELGRYDAALDRLDALARTTPPNPFLVVRRAEILEHAGRRADARREYERALTLVEARPPARWGKSHQELHQRLVTTLAATARKGKPR